MESEIKWVVSGVFNGTVWHITLNGDKIGPPIKSDRAAKELIKWLHQAGRDIGASISEQLGG